MNRKHVYIYLGIGAAVAIYNYSKTTNYFKGFPENKYAAALETVVAWPYALACMVKSDLPGGSNSAK